MRAVLKIDSKKRLFMNDVVVLIELEIEELEPKVAPGMALAE